MYVTNKPLPPLATDENVSETARSTSGPDVVKRMHAYTQVPGVLVARMRRFATSYQP